MRAKLVRVSTNVEPDESIIWSLTLQNVYEVVAIECGKYRIVDDTGRPYLFDLHCFELVDTEEPVQWRSTIIDGDRYASPPEWAQPGFFEDWHDGIETARHTFARVHREIYGREP